MSTIRFDQKYIILNDKNNKEIKLKINYVRLNIKV